MCLRVFVCGICFKKKCMCASACKISIVVALGVFAGSYDDCVLMRVCVCVLLCVCVCLCVCVRVFAYVCIYSYIYMHFYLYISRCIHVNIYVYRYAYRRHADRARGAPRVIHIYI